jgi:hypothetical protein
MVMSTLCMMFLCVVSFLYWVPLHAAEDHLQCTSVVYDPDGHVYVDATLASCVALMSAPSMPVSYESKYKGNLTVTNQLSLNNIINVNEGAASLTVAVYNKADACLFYVWR